jgi:putative ABC transport system permease protein
MTRAELVLKNVFRNRRRTFLTAASVAVSVCLLAVFCATYRYISAPPTPGSFDLVLMVGPRTSLMQPLPLSHGARIAALPGIAAISPLNMVDVIFGAEAKPLFALACDPAAMFKARPDWKLPEDQRQAFFNEKVALVASRRIAEPRGWKLGDRITLRSQGYSLTLELVLRGIYSSAEDESLMTFHWDYLNDTQGSPNKPGAFWVLAKTPEDVPRLMTEIDGMFRNTDAETRTQPMKQFVLDFLAMLGHVKLILLSVSAVVIFAVQLIVANTMGMSIRERTSELAVLRALGFRKRQVLGMLATESLAISITGAALGCLAAAGLLALTSGYQIGGAMPIYIQVDGPTLALTLAVAMVIGLLGTIVPAWHASRVNIAEALRFVG